MSQKGQGPIKEFRAGTVRAAIWREEHQEEQGTVVRHNVRVYKRFFDKDLQDWRTTEYFFANDLPRLRLVAEKAFEHIALRESEGETTGTADRTGIES